MIQEMLDTLAALGDLDPLTPDGSVVGKRCRICDAAVEVVTDLSRHDEKCVWAVNRRNFNTWEKQHIDGTMFFQGEAKDHKTAIQEKVQFFFDPRPREEVFGGK